MLSSKLMRFLSALIAGSLLMAVAGCAETPRSTQAEPTRRTSDTSRPAIPDTPAGRILNDWLTSFNSGEVTQIAAFKEKYQRPGKAENDLMWRADVGGYELLRVEDSQPDSLTVLLKAIDTDGAIRIRLDSEGDRVGDNLRFQLDHVMLPPEFSIQRMSVADALASLTARAERHAMQDRFSGVLLIARNGEVLLHQGWGYADREAKRPVTLDTQFRLGSMNKMFTAVAILQLIDAGNLALNDTLILHIPDYPNQDLASKVTVRHLLTHTGGTGDFFGPDFSTYRTTLKEHSDYLKRFGERELAFEPGTRYAYSNYGFVLLGVIIERISGMTCYEYMQRNVYDVAGMKSTGSRPESENVPERAAGYTRRDGHWTSNAEALLYRGNAAGDAYSTAGDLLRFAEALTAGRLISSETLAEATRSQSPDPTYDYGMRLQGKAPFNSYGHGGGAPGRNSELQILPQAGYVLIGVSNLDPRAAKNMLEHVAARLPIGNTHLPCLTGEN